ncbi:hypothetical protein ABZ281_01635 [Streptomyces sp. NPDC006265]|uniref:hypothetical protein n=1 Tax=Streptomyces sp. NPDC006265 TaxID=3156740 RepID=UPI0033AC46C4
MSYGLIVTAHVVGSRREHPDPIQRESESVVGDGHHQGPHQGDVPDGGVRNGDSEGVELVAEYLGVRACLLHIDGHIEGLREGDHLVDKTGGQHAFGHRAMIRIKDGGKAASRSAVKGVQAGRPSASGHETGCLLHRDLPHTASSGKHVRGFQTACKPSGRDEVGCEENAGMREAREPPTKR